MGRGRQKGQTKILSKIKDSVLGSYEIWLEEDQVILVDISKNKSISYHGSLESAVKKVSYLSLVSKEEDYTLAGFIEMKNDSKNKEDNLPVDLYPTVMIRVNEKIETTLKGYNQPKLLTEMKKH